MKKANFDFRTFFEKVAEECCGYATRKEELDDSCYMGGIEPWWKDDSRHKLVAEKEDVVIDEIECNLYAEYYCNEDTDYMQVLRATIYCSMLDENETLNKEQEKGITAIAQQAFGCEDVEVILCA